MKNKTIVIAITLISCLYCNVTHPTKIGDKSTKLHQGPSDKSFKNAIKLFNQRLKKDFKKLWDQLDPAGKLARRMIKLDELGMSPMIEKHKDWPKLFNLVNEIKKDFYWIVHPVKYRKKAIEGNKILDNIESALNRH